MKNHLPPITLATPLNIFDKLLTTMSAYGRTSTLTKLPIVSSTTIKKSYLSASARRRGRSAERSRGLDGNSVNSANMGGVEGSRLDSFPKMDSSSSMSGSRPCPKKWHPGPHFCRILRVSVYGKLLSHHQNHNRGMNDNR
jgi:hypothetical protein